MVLTFLLEKYENKNNRNKIGNVNNNNMILKKNKNLKNNDPFPKENKSSFNCINLGTFIILTIIFALFISLILDYRTEKVKVNYEILEKINILTNKYNINNCKKLGHLPAIKEECTQWLSEINLLKRLSPSFLEVFSLWIMRPFKNLYEYLNLKYIIGFFALNLVITYYIDKFNICKRRRNGSNLLSIASAMRNIL